MHSVQFQLQFENNTFNSDYPPNPISFVKKLSFDEMASPVYGLMEEQQSEDFEIEGMLVGKNKIPSDPQSQNFCFRKLQFDIGDETDDLFFSTPDTCNTEKATGSATEFITSCETLEVSDFTLHCGPQETPSRNPRDYSLSKRIGRQTCDDLLVSISRTESDDVFKAYEHPRASMGGSPMYVEESDDVVECTPTKFLPTSKNNMRNRGQNAITPQTLVDFVSNAQKQSYLIVDCRYDYEYNGGHIQGAINVETPAALETLFVTYKHLLFNRESLENIKDNFGILQSHPHLLNSLSATNPNDYCVPVIIFHCEFSQKRGPRALRMLREIDRQLNYNDFPNLYYPEVYILEGGYSNFYRQFPEHCSQDNYIKMVDERYKSHYQQARQKEKRVWEVKSSFGKLLNLQRSKTMNFL